MQNRSHAADFWGPESQELYRCCWPSRSFFHVIDFIFASAQAPICSHMKFCAHFVNNGLFFNSYLLDIRFKSYC